MSANLEAKKAGRRGDQSARSKRASRWCLRITTSSPCSKRRRSETSSARRTANTRCTRTPLVQQGVQRTRRHRFRQGSQRHHGDRVLPGRDERRVRLRQSREGNARPRGQDRSQVRLSRQGVCGQERRQGTCGHPFQGSAHREVARLPAVVHFQVRLCARFYCKGKRSGKQLMYF